MERTPTTASNPSEVAAVARLGLATGLGGVVVGLAAAVVGTSTSVDAGVAVRALLVTLLLVLVPRAVAAARRDAGRPVAGPVVGGLALGFAVAVVFLGGHVYAAQLVVDAWPARVLLDGGAWLAVGSLPALGVPARR